MSERDATQPHPGGGAPGPVDPAEAESGRRAALLAHLFDVSPFPAAVSRLSDHKVIAINQHTAQTFGVPQDVAIGASVLDYHTDPTARQRITEMLRRDGRADNLRLQVRRQTGETFWVLASGRLVQFDGEDLVLMVFHDISDQVAVEQTLRASEQRLVAQSNALTELTARSADPSLPFELRLRSILETCANTLQVERLGMWRFDSDAASIRCLGMFRRGATRIDCGAVLVREDAPAYFAALEQERVIAAHDAHTDPRTSDFAASYLTPNHIGAMLDVPLRQERTIGVLCAEHVGGPRSWTVDEQNFAVSVANIVVVAIADQERRQALARVEESDTRAHLILETAHDAFVGMDADGRISVWNAQAESTFGWTRDEVLGRSLSATIIPETFREAHERGMARFLATGEAPVVNRRLELSALHRDGREFPIEITITLPMRQGDGYFFGAFLRDISARRDQDEQLRRAKDAAESATRAKSEFLANMSHELRTPLNGVLGYAQLLQRDRRINPSQREALDAIAKCGTHLLDLINDVLELSKIEAGRIDIDASATDLVQLTVDLKYVVAEAARRKGLTLTMAIASDVPRRVLLDGRHLRQVLLNLLGNAIKFTAVGQVHLGIARIGQDRLSYEVSDTGPGIAPGELSAIFDAFTQTAVGATAGGTGLGLTISQHLVRTMGSELKVTSVVGEGSRFHFVLPLVAADESAMARGVEMAEPPLDARLAPGIELTALVVDDSTVNRRILASLLESAGVHVTTAAGGLEAIELARTHRPDVIFMDLKMSDLDGLEATRRLQQDVATAGIPVIAVTASAFRDARKAALDAGCVDYIPKPVRAEALFAALQTHLGVEFLTEASAAAVEATPLTDPAERRELAARIANAVVIGDVTDLDALAQMLLAGNREQKVLGQRIARLVTGFDFEGLRELASALDEGVREH
jgi:PAS domain S-box-containing protein